jgi:hypothetical protein
MTDLPAISKRENSRDVRLIVSDVDGFAQAIERFALRAPAA